MKDENTTRIGLRKIVHIAVLKTQHLQRHPVLRNLCRFYNVCESFCCLSLTAPLVDLAVNLNHIVSSTACRHPLRETSTVVHKY